ncbi:MAG TPA: EscU/YscU/HrcU family type III secretion system export apparatus switch protein [Steroidobacteraceae bacterium]
MAEKAYKPTQKRLREARKRGEVVRSRELTSLGGFVALWLFFWLGGHFLGRHLNHIIERAVRAADPVGDGGGIQWLREMQSLSQELMWILAPLLGIGVVCAIVAGGLQTKGVISVTPIVPKFDRINPVHGLRNLLSTRQWFELGKMLLKTALLTGMLLYCVAVSLQPLVKMVYTPATQLLPDWASLVWRMMGWAALIYAVSAVLDYAHQFHEFMKRQKMTADEMRRDYREREGDPLIKGHRRALAREFALNTRLVAASVVVMNPTHVAVALQYMPGKTPLPRVVLKGLDARALSIRAEAERHGVPVLEDPPLARKLFREVALDHYINEDLIDVVAAAFRWARQVDRRTIQSASRSPTKNPTPRTV